MDDHARPDKGEHPTYEIRTIGDFFSVPRDRVEVLLHEFCEVIRTGHALVAMWPLASPTGAIKLPDNFTWIDDGKETGTVNVVAGPVTSMATFPLGSPE